jgi:hypothetical protein
MTLDDIRGKHAGRSALLIGGGPSVHGLMEAHMAPHVCVTANAAIFKCPRPDYHCAMDPKMVMRAHYQWVLYEDFPVLVPDHEPCEVLKRSVLPADRLLAFPYRGGFDPPEDHSWAMGIYDDALLKGGSTMHTMIHFAVVAGCSPIYLVGCDGQRVDGKAYFWEYPGYPKDEYWRGLKQASAPLTHHGNCLLRWEWLAKANPDLDLRDCSGGKVSEVVRAAEMGELLG